MGEPLSSIPPVIPVVIDSLAMALVASSDAPIVLLDGDLIVIAASASFSRAFQMDPSGLSGASLFALGTGEWDAPPLRSLLHATLSGVAPVEASEMDLARPGHPARRLVMTAHLLDYGDTPDLRLLLAVSDVTDARLAERLKDDLLREKAILFQELQHRVANSLQIIASVLIQTARRTSSVETKGHLLDAHSRVMSVAALQRQLATSSFADVELRPYLTELCASIGASMIHDPEKLALIVRADEGSASPNASVSLGLIVTELVINALKHAFPEGRSGQIIVGYEAQDSDWTLSVSDDGVGLPADAKAGLGTSIIAGLAKQLGAVVTVTDTQPGTRVSISYQYLSLGDPRTPAA